MASLNRCEFIGNLGKDPECRFMPSGEAVANFSVACTESWKDKDSGEKKEATEWVSCVAFGKLAEIVQTYLKKGAQVYVSGAMKTRKWQNKDGQDRYTTEIKLDKMLMLGSKPEGAAPAKADTSAKEYAKASRGTKFDDLEDDLPFMRPFHGGLWRAV